ncbi:ABC transporter permease [Frigoriglobus tundricola]|uniref:Ribose ABC transport system, permease protein RbsC n=1 Tax=Frigoriglobus tundricola TaxID=2774151 RepID=A0A6M5Z4K8_9BACT|nr:ABC transporter permease [Frigoriglobus tundricola]QJX00655.1 Ribose ABC transport system, permease protein RbsC [Frigoriglobus tundricola]
MTRILGVLGLLVALYAALIESNPAAGSTRNLIYVANNQGRYGIVTLGAALVIIVGGIDLSIGSVVGCAAVLFGVLMEQGVHPFAAAGWVLLFGASVGLVNGLLITRLRLQAFLVTLCGMFVYRGVARMIGGAINLPSVTDAHPEFTGALNTLAYVMTGKNEKGVLIFPAMFALLLVLAAVVGFLVHRTAYGRYWYAIGHNELAAKYAGVNVNRQRVIVYVICSTLAALGGVLLLLNDSTISSDTAGASLELYAILGAVLGGCSLRGGEGTALGMVLGAMVLPVLETLVSFRGLKNDVIPAVIGLTLLLGTIVDELIRRRSRVHR